jgi:hypothetical protein
VVALTDQWYMTYGEPEWQAATQQVGTAQHCADAAPVRQKYHLSRAVLLMHCGCAIKHVPFCLTFRRLCTFADASNCIYLPI